jgi:hypothetical protein
MNMTEAKAIAADYLKHKGFIHSMLMSSKPPRGIGRLFWTERHKDVTYAIDMCRRIQALESEGKVMRWLGFIQGTFVTCGIYTLEDVKTHSRDRKVLKD